MQISEIEKRIEEIKRETKGFTYCDLGQAKESRLHRDVLEAIATGRLDGAHAQLAAGLALTTEKIDFSRHHA